VIVNVSIDGVGDQFTYMRHPSKWEEVEKNVKRLIGISFKSKFRINVVPVVCVSALNVWNFHEVFTYFKKYNITPFIILVQWPSYYCVNVIPDSVKIKLIEHLEKVTDAPTVAIINLLKTQPKLFDESQLNVDTPWDEFKFWTKEKDLYRNEDYVTMFPEYGKILIDHGVW
jgi:hypothetical protein